MNMTNTWSSWLDSPSLPFILYTHILTVPPPSILLWLLKATHLPFPQLIWLSYILCHTVLTLDKNYLATKEEKKYNGLETWFRFDCVSATSPLVKSFSLSRFPLSYQRNNGTTWHVCSLPTITQPVVCYFTCTTLTSLSLNICPVRAKIFNLPSILGSFEHSTLHGDNAQRNIHWDFPGGPVV